MQISADGEKYDSRLSKDGNYEFTIMFDPVSKYWTVDCWILTGQYAGENHWNRVFRDEAKALAEFNRFD